MRDGHSLPPQVVKKTFPTERVGVVCLCDNKYQVNTVKPLYSAHSIKHSLVHVHCTFTHASTYPVSPVHTCKNCMVDVCVYISVCLHSIPGGGVQ